MDNDWTKEIVIARKRRSPSKYEKELLRDGFHQRSGSDIWLLRTASIDHTTRTLIRKYKRRGLTVNVVKRENTRSRTYRSKFFSEGESDIFFCAYCGKKLDKASITIDHIIPIGRAQRGESKLIRALLGIKDINDTRNLAPSCTICNKRKSSKGGLWILRGFLGRITVIRIIFNILKCVMISLSLLVITMVIIDLIWKLKG